MLSRQLTLAASGNQTMKLKDVAVGKVVQVGGIQFVRVGVNKYLATSLCPSGQLFASSTNNCMTIKEYGCKNPQTTMQRWSIGDCESLTTPTGTAYTSGPCLMDERDGKTYEVRKFADGKCWMTTNLKYHSGCDKIFYCGYGYNADETCITTAANAISVSNRIANGLYGDCRAAKDTVDDDGLEGTGTLQGNFYSYQAAVQDNNAHYGQNY